MLSSEEMLSPNEIERLNNRLCPYCNSAINYDYGANNLYCSHCGKSWYYPHYKYCKNMYSMETDEYKKIYREKFSK